MLDDAFSTRREGREEVRKLTEEFVRVATITAFHYARRIGRTLGLGPDDIADVRQELLLEVLRRFGYFDPARAAWTTFTHMVIRHAAAGLADRIADAQRVDGGFLDDLTVQRRGASVRLTDVLAASDGLSAAWSGVHDPIADIEKRLDLERFIEDLPDGLRCLCRLLQTEMPADAQRLSGLSKSEFYRQVEELGMRLRAVGLG